MIPHVVELDAFCAGRVPRDEYARLLGYPPGTHLVDDALELAEDARAWCAEHARPWARARELSVTRLDSAEVHWSSPDLGLAGSFRSADLAQRLRRAGADALCAVGVSAGAEVDAEVERLHASGSFVEATFLDRYGATLAEWLSGEVGRSLADAVDGEARTVLASRGPGREDWDLADQPRLFAALGLEDCDVELTSGGMLRPVNSLLGAYGITRKALGEHDVTAVPCGTCTWSPCRFRR